MNAYWCDLAWLPDGPARDVAITVDDGRITEVTPGAPRAGSVLNGLVMPGFANVHSHAFHRALRGRTSREGGTFWTWREKMYAVADRLDPDSYYRLARGVYAEMVLAGYTSVGEFHYLHHGPRGAPYADRNAMSHALVAAARDAGIRITVLDTCYLAAGLADEQLNPVQQRFSDGDAERWASRVDSFAAGQPAAVVGSAVHSIRAVGIEEIPAVVDWAKCNAAPLHAHISEQRAENDACIAAHGGSPTEQFSHAGALGERFVAVHATHLTTTDIGLLGSASAGACFCPTTERDLADGIGSARQLADAGAKLSIGSDSQAVVDPFEELRGLEMDERLASGTRGNFTPVELIAAGTRHTALGRNDLGAIEQGAPADLVRVAMDSVRTVGSEPEGIALCAVGSDVRDVMVAGKWVVRDGHHAGIGDPAACLATEIGELLR